MAKRRTYANITISSYDHSNYFYDNLNESEKAMFDKVSTHLQQNINNYNHVIVQPSDSFIHLIGLVHKECTDVLKISPEICPINGDEIMVRHFNKREAEEFETVMNKYFDYNLKEGG